ncbi:MAG: acyl-CoA dehydrogenase, partial [Proteobacteria bacterium]
RAARVVVPAATDDGGAALFLVDPAADGVTWTAQRTSTREPLHDLALAGVRVAAGDAFGDAAAVRWLRDAAIAAVCATQVGVSERALEITTGYVRERIQFGVPIGSFQSVQHRAADCWIDVQSMRWTCWRLITRLAEGADVARDTAVAKFWAADAGSRIANAAQHLHGGTGVDVDYPIHRYFLWSKSLELTLGGAMPQLARLGRELAASLPREPA